MAYTPLNVQDRVSTNPGRVTLAPVSGNTYDMTLADNPTQAGTLVNAALFTAIDTELVKLDKAEPAATIYAYKNLGGTF